VISELEAGFGGPNNSIDPIPLDSIVSFDKATASTWALNFRPDVWILPFWNVYGIFAYGKMIPISNWQHQYPLKQILILMRWQLASEQTLPVAWARLVFIGL
jgi:hypothetical protein